MQKLQNNGTKITTAIPSLSVVVTVYSETFSITETIARLMENDRNYIKEIILALKFSFTPIPLTNLKKYAKISLPKAH